MNSIIISAKYLLIARDIIVVSFFMFVVWFISVIMRFGDDITFKKDKYFIFFLVFVGLIGLLVQWKVIIIQ